MIRIENKLEQFYIKKIKMTSSSPDKAFGMFFIEYGSHTEDNLEYPLSCTVDYVKYSDDSSLSAFITDETLVLEPRKLVTSSNQTVVIRPRIHFKIVSEDSRIQNLFSGFIRSTRNIFVDEKINSETGYENYVTNEINEDKKQMTDINLKYSGCHIVFSISSDDGTNPLKKLKFCTMEDLETDKKALLVSTSGTIPAGTNPETKMTPEKNKKSDDQKLSSSKRRSLRRKKLIQSRKGPGS